VRIALWADPDRRVPAGLERLQVGVSAGTRGTHCHHPDRNISLLAREPKPGERPALRLQIRAG